MHHLIGYLTVEDQSQRTNRQILRVPKKRGERKKSKKITFKVMNFPQIEVPKFQIETQGPLRAQDNTNSLLPKVQHIFMQFQNRSKKEEIPQPP